MLLFWFWQMLLPMLLGNLVLLADVIAMLPLGLQLMFSVLAGVIAMLLCCSLWQLVMLLLSG